MKIYTLPVYQQNQKKIQNCYKEKSLYELLSITEFNKKRSLVIKYM